MAALALGMNDRGIDGTVQFDFGEFAVQAPTQEDSAARVEADATNGESSLGVVLILLIFVGLVGCGGVAWSYLERKGQIEARDMARAYEVDRERRERLARDDASESSRASSAVTPQSGSPAGLTLSGNSARVTVLTRNLDAGAIATAQTIVGAIEAAVKKKKDDDVTP